MKRLFTTIIITALLLLSMTPAYCVTEEQKLWNEAAEAYSSKNYEDAVAIYARLVKRGESSALYYNYANALFKAGYTGRAILYYERALRLDPSNADIKYNLDFANLSKTDKTEAVEPFFVTQWYRDVTLLFTSNVWAYISLVLFLLAMFFFLIYRFGMTLVLRKTGFGLFLLFLACFFISIGHSSHARNMVVKNPAAIVLVGSETARSTPDMSGTEVFVIHEGTKVFIKSTLGEWIEVRLEDGNVGWIRNSAVETI
ncbi:MAG: tetratricopeptide repeat protein [Paludibacteraceae bacterium]|nr:tetratricopeptide repeat protein [Paludibacteraceae bacterium]